MTVTARDGLGQGFPFVKGKCPACGSTGLFVGSGGYVTCSNRPCPNPAAPSEVLNA